MVGACISCGVCNSKSAKISDFEPVSGGAVPSHVERLVLDSRTRRIADHENAIKCRSVPIGRVTQRGAGKPVLAIRRKPVPMDEVFGGPLELDHHPLFAHDDLAAARQQRVPAGARDGRGEHNRGQQVRMRRWPDGAGRQRLTPRHGRRFP